MAQPSLRARAALDMGVQPAKWFFLCLGKQNAGMQEPSCISARCNAEREQWDVPTHKHTFHRDMEVGGEHTSATLDRYALFSHQYYQKFLKESASKNYIQMME